MELEPGSNSNVVRLGPLVRLDLFTDAVFAIVITLLALEIDLPHSAAETGLVDALRHMWPIFLAHLISFTVLAIEWIDHHTMFERRIRCTRPLIFSNLFFCLTMTSIPFLTKLIGFFPASKAAVTLYSLGIFAMTVGKELIWQVIRRQDSSAASTARRIRFRSALCVSAIAAGVALFQPKVAVVVWSLFGIYAVVSRFRFKEHHVI